MNLLNKIIEGIERSPEDDKLYLINKCSDIAGFFVSNKKMIYMVKNDESLGTNSIQTEYLRLQSNVSIISVENSQNFQSGMYNLIEYKLPYSENILVFESFINLCLAHIRFMNSKDFVNFFHSLIDLFRNNQEKKQNIYGLFGELSLIKYFYTNYNINLASFWHTSGVYSKYDFSINHKNIEVKTSGTTKNVLIKHSQIFNDDQNFLAIALVENNNSGKSLKELAEELLRINSIGSNYNFILNLETEKARIDIEDYSSKKLKLLDINIYDCKTINPLMEISDNISDIEYRMDLINCEKIKLDKTIIGI